MTATYKIVGGDGATYGPVNLQQLQQWVVEGRVDPHTRVWRSDAQQWASAAELPETGLAPASAAAAVPVTPPAMAVSVADCAILERRANSGASWFYWIAGLSLINSIVVLAGSQWSFILGLGITQVIDAVAHALGPIGRAVGLGLDLAAGGLFVLFGVFAHKRQAWSFVVGMVLYGLDGMFFLVAMDWLGLGFHAFALYCIFSGFRANQQLPPLVPQAA